MKKYIPYIVIFLVGLLIGLLPKGRLQRVDAVQRDTVFVYDTIEYTKEILAEKTKVVYKDKVEYVYVDVEKTDTVYVENKVYVQMPRENYVTETDDVKIWHSGIDSTIDSLNLVRKTQNITETIRTKDKRNYLSAGTEAGYLSAPYMSIYVEYERMLHRNFSIYVKGEYDLMHKTPGVLGGVRTTIGW